MAIDIEPGINQDEAFCSAQHAGMSRFMALIGAETIYFEEAQ
jgi:hypothetical protein